MHAGIKEICNRLHLLDGSRETLLAKHDTTQLNVKCVQRALLGHAPASTNSLWDRVAMASAICNTAARFELRRTM